MKKLKLGLVLKIGVLVGLVSSLVMIAMNLQRQQSYFENSIESIQFECDLAYDEKHELRETIDHNYVQQIIWKADSIRNFSDSFTSKFLLKEKDNQLKVEQAWEEVMNLAQDYSKQFVR